jgi:hypothetical protein
MFVTKTRNALLWYHQSLSSSTQILICQRTRRNEVMKVNNVTDTLCAESPGISESYNNDIFVLVLRTMCVFRIFKPEVICPLFTQFDGFMARTRTHIHTYTAVVGRFRLT